MPSRQSAFRPSKTLAFFRRMAVIDIRFSPGLPQRQCQRFGAAQHHVFSGDQKLAVGLAAVFFSIHGEQKTRPLHRCIRRGRVKIIVLCNYFAFTSAGSAILPAAVLMISSRNAIKKLRTELKETLLVLEIFHGGFFFRSRRPQNG